jgi:DeoR family transcriptional regulator, galactitol utilization operon repressor
VFDKLTERERLILEMLADDGSTSIADIAAAVRVSQVTARNDLSGLEEKGFIVRTRGGAFPAFHRSIVARQKSMTEAKIRIAKAAAAMVEPGDTIMIEAGTTTALIAKYLLGKRDVHVVSNSTLILPYARFNPSLHVTIVGGSFQSSTESLVGPMALRELEEFHVSIAFVGTDGFSIENGLTTHLLEGAEIVKRMSAQAQKTVLVADSSKYGKTGFVRVLPLTSADTIISDSELDGEITAELKAAAITVKLA